VLCSAITRSYLINYARTLIYTTFMPFTALASIEVTYNFLTTGRAKPLVAHLRSIIRHAHKLFVSICLRQRPPPHLFRLLTGEPESPIIPLLTCHPRSLAQHCQQRGFMVRPIVAPTVPLGSERVRVCLHAGHTVEEVQGLARAVEEWVAEWKAKEDVSAPVVGGIEKPKL
jgi:8-amino-7-oxononanoate synthase